MLVLNATYEPLSVISVPRAIHLLLAKKAELVENSDKTIRSASLNLPVPVVIRLHYYVKIPHNLPLPLSRRALLMRDDYTCQYCGIQPGKEHLTMDHILPRSRGGKTEWENMATACAPCNRKKGNRTPEEAHMKLRRPPIRPRFWSVALMAGPNNEVWKKYLLTK